MSDQVPTIACYPPSMRYSDDSTLYTVSIQSKRPVLFAGTVALLVSVQDHHLADVFVGKVDGRLG